MARQSFHPPASDRQHELASNPQRRPFAGPYGRDNTAWRAGGRDLDDGITGDDRDYPAGFGAGYGGSTSGRAQNFGTWRPPEPYDDDFEPDRHALRSGGRDGPRGEAGYGTFDRERYSGRSAARSRSAGRDIGDDGNLGGGWRPLEQRAVTDDSWGRDPRRMSLSDPYGEQQQRQRQVPKGYVRSDERIRDDVCEKLFHADDVQIADVSVEVKNGTVTLEGCVPQRQMKHRIEDIVEQCIGVGDVENRIRVQRAGQQTRADANAGSDKPATLVAGRH